MMRNTNDNTNDKEEEEEEEGVTTEGGRKRESSALQCKRNDGPGREVLRDARDGADAASRIAAAAAHTRPDVRRLPESSILQRLRTFLPEMASANSHLLARVEAEGAEKFDIEHISDGDEEDKTDDEEDKTDAGKRPCIEMDIGLGLFDIPDERLACAVDAESPGEIHLAGEHGDDGNSLDPIAKAALGKRASDGAGDDANAGGSGVQREKRGKLIHEVT